MKTNVNTVSSIQSFIIYRTSYNLSIVSIIQWIWLINWLIFLTAALYYEKCFLHIFKDGAEIIIYKRHFVCMCYCLALSKLYIKHEKKQQKKKELHEEVFFSFCSECVDEKKMANFVCCSFWIVFESFFNFWRNSELTFVANNLSLSSWKERITKLK